MYLQNKYTIWYYSIINNAINREITGYTEKHHVIPKSLGGSDCNDNIVKLTAREHFICHWLLVKITTGNDRYKMSHAFWRLVNCSPRYKITSRAYQSAKVAVSEERKGKPMPKEQRIKLSQYRGEKNSRYNAVVSEETKRKMSIAQSGVNNSNYNKRWFNDGVSNYFIYETDAKEGLVKGRLLSQKHREALSNMKRRK